MQKSCIIVHVSMNDIIKLYMLDPESRRKWVSAKLNKADTKVDNQVLLAPCDELGDSLIENYIGYFHLPIGIVENIAIGDMLFNACLAVEETSVVAALNKANSFVRKNGFIELVEYNVPEVTGQISYEKVKLGNRCLLNFSEEIYSLIKSRFASYFRRENPFVDIQKEEFDDFIVYNFSFNSHEAMGANFVTQVTEVVSDFLKSHDFPHPLMNIISNTMKDASVRMRCKVKIDEEVGIAISKASLFAHQDPRRASTHNKGILNAIDPILIATGNDWRASNAVIHSFACKDGQYKSLTKWTYEDDHLIGEIALPFQIGVVGGVTKIHPNSQFALEYMGIDSKKDLCLLLATAGLLQNLSALRALVTTGIVSGHMKLHLSNLSKSYIFDSENQKSRFMKEVEDFLKNNKKITQTDADMIYKELS